MIKLVAFEVGQQYENRKGIYEVLEIDGDAMRIRWEDGIEIETSVTMQSHIINQIQFQLDRLAVAKIVPLAPKKKPRVSKGVRAVRSSIIATSFRADALHN